MVMYAAAGLALPSNFIAYSLPIFPKVYRNAAVFLCLHFHTLKNCLVMKILCRGAEGKRVVRDVSHISPIVVSLGNNFHSSAFIFKSLARPSKKTHRSASTIKRVQHIIYLCLSFSLFPLSPQGIMSEYTRITQQRLDIYIISCRKDTENCFKKHIWLGPLPFARMKKNPSACIHGDSLHKIFMCTSRAFISLFIVTLAFVHLLHLQGLPTDVDFIMKSCNFQRLR